MLPPHPGWQRGALDDVVNQRGSGALAVGAGDPHHPVGGQIGARGWDLVWGGSGLHLRPILQVGHLKRRLEGQADDRPEIKRSADFDRDAIQGDIEQDGLDDVGMHETACPGAEQHFRRSRADSVPGQPRPGIAGDEVIAHASAAHARITG